MGEQFDRLLHCSLFVLQHPLPSLRLTSNEKANKKVSTRNSGEIRQRKGEEKSAGKRKEGEEKRDAADDRWSQKAEEWNDDKREEK